MFYPYYYRKTVSIIENENKSAVPKYEYEKISDISVEDLRAMGVKGVGIDIDNTTAYDSTLTVFSGVKDWVKTVQDAGIKVIIISNTYSLRAKIISKKIGHIPYIAMARKPMTKNFFLAAKKLGIQVNELAMIGDQLFTDILGANSAGAISILVHYARPEVFLGSRYKKLRAKEHSYLKNMGYKRRIGFRRKNDKENN